MYATTKISYREIIPHLLSAIKSNLSFYGNTFIISKKWRSIVGEINSNNTKKETTGKTWRKKLLKHADIKKPHGKNWFSPAAHKSLSVMKKEYRVLALKYHPDNQEYDAEVFVNIQEEKNYIISKTQK